MNKRKKTPKYNIPMYVALILFCLVLISIHLSSGLYAKYTTTASGSDGARTIKFGDVTITEDGDFYSEGRLYYAPGVSVHKKATVSFTGSEAATYVFIEVDVSSHWTSSADAKTFSVKLDSLDVMTWSIADGWTHLPTSDGRYVYYRAVDPNGTIDNVNIIADEMVTVSENLTRTKIKTLTGMYVDFRAVAVQANGFESAADAWDSVKTK